MEILETNYGIKRSERSQHQLDEWAFLWHGMFGIWIVSWPNLISKNAKSLAPQIIIIVNRQNDSYSWFSGSNLTPSDLIWPHQWPRHGLIFRDHDSSINYFVIWRISWNCYFAFTYNVGDYYRVTFQINLLFGRRDYERPPIVIWDQFVGTYCVPPLVSHCSCVCRGNLRQWVSAPLLLWSKSTCILHWPSLLVSLWTSVRSPWTGVAGHTLWTTRLQITRLTPSLSILDVGLMIRQRHPRLSHTWHAVPM